MLPKSDLKVYSCATSKCKDQCIGVLEVKNKEIISPLIKSSPIDGQRFVACGTQATSNNYNNKMKEDQLKSLPYYQNYLKGNPSKVIFNICFALKIIILGVPYTEISFNFCLFFRHCM